MNIPKLILSAITGLFVGLAISRTMEKDEPKVVPAKPSKPKAPSPSKGSPPPRPLKDTPEPVQKVEVSESVSEEVKEQIGNLKSPRGLDALPPEDVPTLKISDSGIVEKPQELPPTMGARPRGQDVEVPLSTLIAMKKAGQTSEEIKKSYNEDRNRYMQEIADRKMRGDTPLSSVEEIERQNRKNDQNVKQEDIDKFLTEEEKKQYGLEQQVEKPNAIIEEVKKNGGVVIQPQKGQFKNELEDSVINAKPRTTPIGVTQNRRPVSARVNVSTNRGGRVSTQVNAPQQNNYNSAESRKQRAEAFERSQNPTGMPTISEIQFKLPDNPVGRKWQRVIGVPIKGGRGVIKRLPFPYDNYGAVKGMLRSQGYLTTQQVQEHLNKYYGN